MRHGLALVPVLAAVALAAPGERVAGAGTDVELREVVAWIASLTGSDVRCDEGVRAAVTWCVADAPRDEVLAAIAHATSHVLVRRGDALVLARDAASGEPLVLPATPPPRRPPPPPLPAGSRRIDVDVDGVDLAELMASIGRQVGARIEVGPHVRETVTVSLRDIPWREAVEVIARMTRCEVTERDGALVLDQCTLISIQFTRARLRTVVQLLVAYQGQDLVLGHRLEGVATLDARADVRGALAAVVRAAGGAAEERGGLLVVADRPGFGAAVASTAPTPAPVCPVRVRARGAPADVLVARLAALSGRVVAIAGPSEAALATPIDLDAEDAVAGARAAADQLGWRVQDLGGAWAVTARPAAPRASAPARVQVQVGGRARTVELQATLVPPDDGAPIAVVSGEVLRIGDDLETEDGDQAPRVRLVDVEDGLVRLRVDEGEDVEVRLPR